MGRVYRARDTQLVRTVAVKVLPEAFTAAPDLLRRFEQEARATAALNHPGIMAIYDVGVHENAPYLVSELLEGTTLRERMSAGRLPFATVLDFAIQVADALAVAHAKGIVHRDLKPENLFVCRDDRLKILDFGLAKLTAGPAGDPRRIDITGTLPNTVLGTPAYMPPEQARGDPADHRSDIFSLGCIVYEMLEGQKPFDGPSAADVISSILKDSPPPLQTSVERTLPPALDSIVQRCLAKDPASRFQSAGDLAFALRSVSLHGGQAPPPHALDRKPGWWSRRVAWSMAAIAGLAGGAALIGLAGMPWRAPTPPSRVIEFLVPPPTDDQLFAPMPLPGLLPTAPQVGLSPDGSRLAFVTGDSRGQRRLWLRSLDSSQARAVDGTEGVNSWPFWSPDSRHVVIAVGRALMKVDATTGSIETLCSMPDETPAVPFVTGSWNDDGVILFSIGGENEIYRTAAFGGAPTRVTTLDKQRGDHYHSWPQLLGGSRFLLFVRTNDAATNGVYAGTLGSSDIRLVHASASRAVYANGRLLWAIDDRVVAQPFDPEKLTLTDQPASVVPSVFQGAGRTPAFWASSTDTLLYAAGDTRERQFRAFSRAGEPGATIGPPGLYVTFDASADLGKVVVEVSKDIRARFSTLALIDGTRGAMSPLTLGDQNDSDPRFGPGGEVVFARNSKDAPGLTRIDPAIGQAVSVFARGKLPVLWLEDWSPDGNSILYRSGADRDAWQLLAGHGEPRRLTEAQSAIEQVQLSPDGQWIAYNTAETGRSEVFISSVPAGGERRQVSVAGGVQPIWRGDGRELYYLSLDGALHSVDIATAGRAFTLSAPRLLFRTPLPVVSAVVEQYRASGDGQRFLFCLPLTSVRSEPLRMLLNWPARLTKPERID
jgi:eukaryotic-like serine/threonine-protein kinase